jgi:phosphatidylglycerol:prolipoprotein diacylglycerol transferase
MDMSFVFVISALLGSRLMYVLLNASYFKEHPLAVFKLWEGGLVFSGGVVAAIIAIVIYARVQHASVLGICDFWSPAAAIGQSIGRVGCFMAGCCYGKPSDLPWHVVFSNPHCLAPLGVPLHPVQLYASAFGLIIFAVLLLLHHKKKFDGQVFLWFLILHSTARLFVERLRGDNRATVMGTEMTATQLISLLILLAATATLLMLKKRGTRRIEKE